MFLMPNMSTHKGTNCPVLMCCSCPSERLCVSAAAPQSDKSQGCRRWSRTRCLPVWACCRVRLLYVVRGMFCPQIWLFGVFSWFILHGGNVRVSAFKMCFILNSSITQPHNSILLGTCQWFYMTWSYMKLQMYDDKPALQHGNRKFERVYFYII